ncbi:hypothetical protein [Candidatus Parabeggiatoa sp. HSG14]|uniref:hypothetical protein n=1 Tax=Candidatus Parabeggiatoa sp. HSG14 TaxID=3055593 RepID=UPI0025A736CE|nr:hypothetical protein [Thiotrichales bacterium HSG14]
MEEIENEKQAALEKAGQAEKTLRRIVQQLLQANTDIAIIMQITGLDKAEIENMKSNERKSN